LPAVTFIARPSAGLRIENSVEPHEVHGSDAEAFGFSHFAQKYAIVDHADFE
jgi:hypothetical protein